MARLPRIGITLGDPAGIGPEILAKTLAEQAILDRCIPIVVGDRRIVEQAFRIIKKPHDLYTIDDVAGSLAEGTCYVYDLANLDPKSFTLGEIDPACGKAAGEYIEAAIKLALEGHLDAVVTNPIHKEAFIAGYGDKYPGHTEMFADLTGAKSYCMMLACGDFRVCHVTTHVSLLDALTKYIKRDRILDVIQLADDVCKRIGIEKPRIGVAGVNPHAGEDGTFGDEEAREVIPALEAARARGIDADGPVPGDTLFSKALGGMYDVAVAMYHDQGHIPVKLAGFKYNHETEKWDMQGINVTLGLPIIRTSVDHGTAFDKAGKGTADHRSLVDAIDYAVMLAGER